MTTAETSQGTTAQSTESARQGVDSVQPNPAGAFSAEDAGAPLTRPLFKLQQQSLGWEKQSVLDAVNLEIHEGEKVAIIGKSGAGKTTLIRALYQQQPSNVAYCGQEHGLVPSLSVFHNIYMGQLDKHHFLYNALNLLRPFKAEVSQVTPLAESLRLNEKLFEPTGKLSGGQQQRVALGRTLYQNKPTFIGDEPVSSIDEVHGEQILELIISHHKTTILTLHNVDLALRFCTRIIGIRNGRIELDNHTEKLSAEQLKSLYQD
ncbi:ATP-binding cassette domain-containing protein [Alkalimarinus coralli]|uniref:ATP-binding cassette domain-containing protein n=1 Tax=Alkalimarinus coralli TaxID=2935863 RepID=UPI00202B9B50|nr:ATP-binding cassette domain-containing protein [Alkalimarinus coralli]